MRMASRQRVSAVSRATSGRAFVMTERLSFPSTLTVALGRGIIDCLRSAGSRIMVVARAKAVKRVYLNDEKLQSG